MKQKSNSVIVCIPRNIYVAGTMSSVLRVLYFLLFGITNRSQRIMEWKNLDGHSVTFLCFRLLLLRDLNYDDPNCLKSGLTEMPTVFQHQVLLPSCPCLWLPWKSSEWGMRSPCGPLCVEEPHNTPNRSVPSGRHCSGLNESRAVDPSQVMGMGTKDPTASYPAMR